jgi:hypothetical protein
VKIWELGFKWLALFPKYSTCSGTVVIVKFLACGHRCPSLSGGGVSLFIRDLRIDCRAMIDVTMLHGSLTVHLKSATKLYNAENLGVPGIGRALAKLARLKIDPYVNIHLGGAFCLLCTFGHVDTFALQVSSTRAGHSQVLETEICSDDNDCLS